MTRATAALLVIAACGADGTAAREECGWRCGPMNECPDGFACYADGRCHAEGSPDRGCSLDGGMAGKPPSLVAWTPGDNETEVATDVIVRVRFDEPVLGVDASTLTMHRETSFEPLPAAVTYDELEHTATLVPERRLQESGLYVVTVAPTITDANGYPFVGRSWQFTTVRDVAPPRVVSITPRDGATNVGVEDPVLVAFSEPVWNVTSATFTVRDLAGNSLVEYTYPNPQLARVDAPWRPNTTYIVTLTSEVADVGGNQLVGAPVRSTFTTGPDSVAPRITYRSPGVDETGVDPSSWIYLGFSEPVIGYESAIRLEQNGVLVPETVTYIPSSNMVRLRPEAPLALDTSYSIVIRPGLTDASGNPVVPATFSWTFRTEP